VTVPGEAFGMPGFVRLSYALAMDQLKEGVARIQSALSTK
jgi:aspartate aminotransferase